MALALILLVGAAVAARAAGGSWFTLARLPIRGGRLVAIAVVAQLLGGGLARLGGHSGYYSAGLAVSAVAALTFCMRNIRLAGVPLITAGLVANALVVGLNSGMPVSIAAAARARVPIAAIASGDDPRHTIAGYGTTWRALGDVIPVPLPWRPEVVSPGDALIAAGLGEFVVLGMRPRRRRGRDGDLEARSAGAGAHLPVALS